ncbi:thiol-disulfide oxidoreductase DCC family protein [Rhodopirellula islandica]
MSAPSTTTDAKMASQPPVDASHAPDRSSDLPDPDQCPACDVVIYDGQCNFCKAGVRSLRRLDWGGNRLAFLSLHDERVQQRYPDLTQEQLMDQMYVIDQHDQRHGGADAVRYLSRRLPMLWLAAPVLHLPGTAKLWRRLYHELAKRRYRLAGKSCDTGSCSIH